MPRWTTFAALLLIGGITKPHTADTINPNDNRRSAGRLDRGILTVALEARTGVWHPEGDGGRVLDVAAFAEEGKPLSTPGPFIRVPVGTTVRATIRNRLDEPLVVFGFGKTRTASDTVVVPPGEVTSVSFMATQPGTFHYSARRHPDIFGGRVGADGQLNGIIIVDPRGVRPDPAERTMAVSWSCDILPTSRTGLDRCVMTINGLSWPHTERLTYAQGDSIRWRVVNFTDLDHPMHLHGFFFRVNAKGNGVTDSLFAPNERRMAVTEVLAPFETMSLAWKADRPGNWIFHCHYAVHLSDLVSLDTKEGATDHAAMTHHPSDRPHQMFGLVMGLTVTPKGSQAPTAEPARTIRILQREKPNVYGSQPGMSFVVDGTPEAAQSDGISIPGPTLVLERGQRVAVTVVNQSNDRASVHWHGIELESYADGVPGWSGFGASILPSIAPHDSLTVRWTPPREGSYMYHSHFSEVSQMGRGLYGPIIVLAPGERFDPETDRVLFFGTAGTNENVVFGPFTPFVLNGKTQPADMAMKVGTTYRFRLFNLAGDAPLMVSMNDGEKPIQWRAVAKDGFALPSVQATMRPAVLVFDPGEIYDFEVTPATAGELNLKFGPPPFPPPPPPPPGTPPLPFAPPPPTITVPIHVR